MHFSQRYPAWAVDILAPQKGETQDGTSGYTSLVATAGNDDAAAAGAIVCYDKMSSATQDRVFCMRVKVEIIVAEVPDGL